MEGYNSCQRNKNHTEQPVGKLMPNSIPEKPWIHISADFITKLPIAQGYDLILVVVDRLTKTVYFIPTIEKTSAEGLARLFRDNIWKLYSVTNFIWTITPGILDWFQQSKWPPKALKNTFQMVPKTSQSDQYSPSYQQISQWSPGHRTLNHQYLRNCLT